MSVRHAKTETFSVSQNPRGPDSHGKLSRNAGFGVWIMTRLFSDSSTRLRDFDGSAERFQFITRTMSTGLSAENRSQLFRVARHRAEAAGKSLMAFAEARFPSVSCAVCRQDGTVFRRCQSNLEKWTTRSLIEESTSRLTVVMTRNFAVFLASLACLVLAAPFADRKDWQGWGASIVVFGALGTMLVLWLRRFIENVVDWWRDDRESPF